VETVTVPVSKNFTNCCCDNGYHLQYQDPKHVWVSYHWASEEGHGVMVL